ncbi:hypothetical protein FOZ62_008250 [Perkinsus olseni]|uniref:Uncharacterized protein n=1 Tax=Perkinsus olseni TaxID=32597 RepID=A0A7J6S0B1_PEROL|nr:hypothetical protein FOZ62_008250 [Perkinsus olseni]
MAISFSTRLLPFISVMVSALARKAHPSRVASLRPNITAASKDVIDCAWCSDIRDTIKTCTIAYEGLHVEVALSEGEEDAMKGRGAALSKETKEYDITPGLAAKYPLSSLFEPVKAILETGVTKETCSEVAKYIENNPRGPFRNEGRMPWLYQFMLDPGLDKYEGYKFDTIK